MRNVVSFVMGSTLLALMLLSSCEDPKNSVGWPGPMVPSNIMIDIPDNMTHGVTSQWSVSWTSTDAPFKVNWNFGNGAVENEVVDTLSTNTSIVEAEHINASLDEDVRYTIRAIVTDANGRSNSATAVYSVNPNTPPVIVREDFDTQADELVLELLDAEGGELTIWYSNVAEAPEDALTVDIEPGIATTYRFELDLNGQTLVDLPDGTFIYVQDSAGNLAETRPLNIIIEGIQL